MISENSSTGKPSLVVMGIGNTFRHDDGLGIYVAHRVSEEAGDLVSVFDNMRCSTDLIEAWQGADAAIIVDAVSSEAEPGTIFQIEAGKHPVPERFFHYSTHNLSISEAVDLSRALGTLPPRLTIYGIQGENFQIGTGLSPDVEEATEKVVQAILKRAYSEHESSRI